VHAVLRQRLSLEETQRVQAHLAEECGQPIFALGAADLCRTFPSALVVADNRLEFLPRSTADLVRRAARAVAAVRSNAPADDLILKLRAIEGVGDAAIEYVAMRALNDSDALPGDLVELRGARGEVLGPRELSQRTAAWKPWRAYAAMLLMCTEPDLDVPRSMRARGEVAALGP
jgi:AraC family transcriptional regulator of adaptative response / DNA-3-methyladenine glycosylase II